MNAATKTEQIQYINDCYDIMDSMYALNEEDNDGTADSRIRCEGRLARIKDIKRDLKAFLGD